MSSINNVNYLIHYNNQLTVVKQYFKNIAVLQKHGGIMTFLTLQNLRGILLICQNTTMGVYGAWIKRYCVLCSTRQIWGIWKLRPAYSPETPNLGENGWCFVLCDLEIWWMTLENNRASLLCCFKLCATFHSHRWIKTGLTVRKRPIWVKFDDFFLAMWLWNLTDDIEKQ